VCNLKQFLNASLPILVTVAGMRIVSNFEQSMHMPRGIVVKFGDKDNDVIELQL
jgi:hypothetical protein